MNLTKTQFGKKVKNYSFWKKHFTTAIPAITNSISKKKKVFFTSKTKLYTKPLLMRQLEKQ